MKSIKNDNHKALGHRFWSISDTNQLITYRCLSILSDFDRVSELSICYALQFANQYLSTPVKIFKFESLQPQLRFL